jgi:hypothetical protein
VVESTLQFIFIFIKNYHRDGYTVKPFREKKRRKRDKKVEVERRKEKKGERRRGKR